MTTEQVMNTMGRAFADVLAANAQSEGIERYKLDRLIELRAVIASLRAERDVDHPFAVRGAHSRPTL